MHGFPHKPQQSILSLHVGSFIYCFPSKRHESWMHVTLLPSFGLGFNNNETTETHSNLNWSPQQ
jgi:hypothetical protein